MLLLAMNCKWVTVMNFALYVKFCHIMGLILENPLF